MKHTTGALPDKELQLWLSLTRRLPALRGTGRLARMIGHFYNRKPRPATRANALGFDLVLDPTECVDRELLFSPQVFDRREMACLAQHLKPGDVFLDAGANIGIYSLVAARLVGERGHVLAVEAAPDNAARIATHLRLSGIRNVQVANVGLSDQSEVLRLGLATNGNCGSNSFLYRNATDYVDVPCQPLADLLVNCGLLRLDGAKMDIEGFEVKVLRKFFATGPRRLWPRFLIIEVNRDYERVNGDSVLGLLAQQGYRLTRLSEANYLGLRDHNLD